MVFSRDALSGGSPQRFDLRSASEVGIVAVSFVLFNQYWKIDEHVVFGLVLLLTVAMLLNSKRFESVKAGADGSLFFFLGFLIWVLLSVSWSPTPGLSLSYAMLVGLASLTAIIQGALFGVRILALGISLGVAALVLHVTYWELLGGARSFPFLEWGLYTNPSSLSFVIGVGSLAAIFSLSRNPLTWLFLLSYGVVAFAWLAGLQIMGAFFSLLGALAAGVALLHLRSSPDTWKTPLAYGYTLAVLGGGAFFWIFREAILRPLGEDASLSERVPLWGLYFEAVLWRPWIGSGWGSTVGWDFPLSEERLTPVYEWFPAHNGYLDIALMLGFFGLFLFLGALFSLLWASLVNARSREFSWRSVFFPVLIAYLMLNDMVATSFPKLMGLFLVGLMIGNTVRVRGDLRLSRNSGANSEVGLATAEAK